MSYFENVNTTIKDGSQVDAFSRLRVSNPTTLFDNKLPYGKSSTLWSEQLINGATSVHDPNNSCVDMVVTSSGDVAIRQTKQRYKYQSGKSQLIEMTGCLEPVSGTNKALGYIQCSTTSPHALDDGVCFESIGTTMYVSVYKNGTPNRVAQSSWNVDKLDGSGPSGITADWSKCQIFQIDLQWLGVGRVRYYINIDGSPIWVHEIDHANAVNDVYMRSGSQPLTYRLESTGSAGSLKQICSTVQSEGGSEPTGIVAVVKNGAVSNVTTTFTAVLGIRLKNTALGSATTELDSIIDVVRTYILCTTNDNMEWGLAWNPVSVTAGPGTWSDVQGSSLQLFSGTDATSVVTPGLLIDGGAFSNQVRTTVDASLGNLKLGSDVDGTPDEIYLIARSISGTANISAAGIQVRQLV